MLDKSKYDPTESTSAEIVKIDEDKPQIKQVKDAISFDFTTNITYTAKINTLFTFDEN